MSARSCRLLPRRTPSSLPSRPLASNPLWEYEDAHGVCYDRDALAEKARQKLSDVGHSE